jgi:hypothetical protein
MDTDLILGVATLVCAAANLCDYLFIRRGGLLYFPASGWANTIGVVLFVAALAVAGLRLFGVVTSGYTPYFVLPITIFMMCYSIIARHTRKTPAVGL